MKKLIKATPPRKTGQQTLKRLHERSGLIASRTPLSSEVRGVTVTFTSQTFQKLKLAADLSGVSTSAMVRQCVRYLLDPRDA